MARPEQLEAEAAARLAADLTSYALGVPAEEIMTAGRGRPSAVLARQIAMYLCHTGCTLSLARVAAAFGRDRSTVAHACRLIEDKRDEPTFDGWIGALENALREAPPRGGAAWAAQ